MKVKIIFHIGAGKTGTSSIQGSLKNSEDALLENGVKYLGLMLEYAPVKKYEWQAASANKEFMSLTDEDAHKQIYDVITDSIKELDGSGVHTLIWSNEWFMGRHDAVLPPMKQLSDDGHQVQIIAYVRRHDAWAKSAYSQWGIKHKTYPGKLLSFKKYIENRPVRFSGAILPWAKSFNDNLILKNFDSIKDVVEDFCDSLSIDKKYVQKKRVNDSPGPEELLVRALFNNHRANEVMPVVFDRLFHTINLDLGKDPVTWMRQLLPNENDLNEVKSRSEDDLRIINHLLEERGQEKISFVNKSVDEFTINHNVAYSILFQMLERQAIQLQQLRKEMMAIKKSI